MSVDVAELADPQGRIQHVIANIKALWSDPQRAYLPHDELYASARQDIMTLLRHLDTPARRAALEQHDRATIAEAYLGTICRLLHIAFATPALAAGLQVYAAPGAPESLYHQLDALLLAPDVHALLPPQDTAPAALPMAAALDALDGDAAEFAGVGHIAAAMVEEHREAVAQLTPVPPGYHDEQAQLLGEEPVPDTGEEPAL